MESQIFILKILLFFASGLAGWAITSMLVDTIMGTEKRDEIFVESPAFRVILPFAQAIGRVLERFPAFDKPRENIERKLTMAGKRDAISPDELLGACVVTALIGVAVGVWLDYFMGITGATYAALVLLCGFLPMLGLGDMIKKRHHQIRRALPYTLDLLTLAVEAGLDFTAALTRITDKLKGNPFQDEVRKLTRDLAMGKTRAEALKDMSERVRLEDLQSVVSALVQADELGSALGPTLRIQASEMRRRRFQLAEKKAMEAPVKMLGPLVIFIFPLVFIIVFGPIALKVLLGGI